MCDTYNLISVHKISFYNTDRARRKKEGRCTNFAKVFSKGAVI